MNLINSLKSIILALIIGIADILIIIGMSLICTNFPLGPWYNAIPITIGVTIGNIILWPILRKFLMKFIIITFGVGALIINSLIFYLVSYIVTGFLIGGYESFMIPLLMAIASTLITNIANIDYYDAYMKKIAEHVTRDKKTCTNKFTGLIML